jgi:phosphate transport system substrate-binding protein
VCRRILVSHHDAEDAFQATFLVLVRKAASILPREAVASWLHGVAQKTALKTRAATARRKTHECQSMELPEVVAAEKGPDRDLLALLEEELSRLPDSYRAVVVLCDLEERTRKEAARQLGVPEGTVAGRLSRARELLASRLARRGLSLPGTALGSLLALSPGPSVPEGLLPATARLGAASASVPGENVVALAEGVLKAMFVSRLKMAALVLGLAVLVSSAAVGSQLLPSTEPGTYRANPPARPAPGQAAKPAPRKKEERLQATGSVLVHPLMQDWTSRYHADRGIQVDYQATGSGAAIRQVTEGLVDFGCTDLPLTDKQLKAARDKGTEVIHVPLCGRAVVLAYNLPGVARLVLSGRALVDVYRGKITRWNDPALVGLNPTVKLPNLPIVVAYRSDTSSSTSLLTDYFVKIDAQAWTAGRGTVVRFPVGTGHKGPDGMIRFIERNQGAIGYLEWSQALPNKVPFAQLVNSAGQAIPCSAKSVKAAAAAARVPDDLRYSLTSSGSKEAYPIAGTVWAIVPSPQANNSKTRLVRDFLAWSIHDGQKLAEKRHCVPLPEEIVKLIDRKLKQLEGSK